jgi:hypothetical protein
MSDKFTSSEFVRYAGSSMYFVINSIVVGRLDIDGTLALMGEVAESQALPAAPTSSVGYDSDRGTIYIPLPDKTRLFEIDSNGDVSIAGGVMTFQTIAWSGNNWEIANSSTKAWANIAGYRPLDFVATTLDMDLAGDVLSYEPNLGTLPTVIILTHAIAADFEFNENSWVKRIQGKTRSKVIPSLGMDGGRESSDGKLQARMIEVETIIREASPALYRAAKDALYQAVSRSDLLLWLDYERYAPLALLDSYREVFLPGYFGVGARFIIRFEQELPLWLSADLVTDTQAITSSPETYFIQTDSQQNVFPIFEITAEEDLPTFEIENVTDGRTLEYNDSFFENGRTVTIDCEHFTVELDGGLGNRIHQISGQPLRLLGGANNEIKVTGGNCSILTTYRNRYI